MAHRRLKITDQEVDMIREHFGQSQNPPIAWLAALFDKGEGPISETYISDILRGYRRQDTKLRRRVNRRKGLAKHKYPIW